MSEKCITSQHIQKLGHEIREIRERALTNIKSKLEHGFDNTLARSKELLTKLIEWFLFENCTKQETVFLVIKKILASDAGKSLIAHNGSATIKKDLKQIRTFIEPKYYNYLDEICQMLDDCQIIVPPLVTDTPLSYRTGEDDFVGTTATTIEGFILEETSVPQKTTPPNDVVGIYTSLKWQSLIEADRHILQSIEDSLNDPPQPSSLLHSTDFFKNILLKDFPAEVFLQRPNILSIFYELMQSPSTRIVNSVLSCLNNLTKALGVRLHHSNDPCLLSNNDFVDDTDVVRQNQITISLFCSRSYKRIFQYLCSGEPRHRKNQRGLNLCLDLLDEMLKLFNQSNEMNEILVQYGDTLDYFRFEVMADDSDPNLRVTQLCLLHNCVNFLRKMVPINQAGYLLPRNLKNVLTETLVDVILLKLYPHLYNTILDFVESFKIGLESESLVKYKETQKICQSMTSTMTFLQNENLATDDAIKLAIDAIPSLEYHQNLEFVQKVIELCVCKLGLHRENEELLDNFEHAILQLLSHNLETVRYETYGLCQKYVMNSIGPKLNGAPGTQILFLCRWRIFTEIACHGITSKNIQIKTNAEDILLHILKCKLLVCEDVWNKIVEAIIISLPVLCCHVDNNSALGRTLLSSLDPDTAQNLLLPKDVIVKGNILILFVKNTNVREEAFSRLCWLLASQNNSRELLPKLNNLYDKALPNITQLHRVFDINKHRPQQNFYQPSSLQQVLDLLRSPKVEPVIRRSALTQISVMLEDSLLHTTFLQNNGLEIVLEIMQSALIEKNYSDYPDSVIPAVAILKSICLSQAKARQRLNENPDALYNILRSVFLFFAEDKLRSDAVCVLFLLLWSDFVKGAASKANFSVPFLATEKLQMPFICDTYLHDECNDFFELITTDKHCLSSLQIQWNCEIFGGLNELKESDEIEGLLKLRKYDLLCLRASDVDYFIRKYLMDVQNGTAHNIVIDTIINLTTYVHLCSYLPKPETLLRHQWEKSFSRFLKILPSGEEDVKLLNVVLIFLAKLTPFYKSEQFWLSELLKNPQNPILDLITIEQTTSDDLKTLSHDFLALITQIASQEQHFLDFYATKSHHYDVKNWQVIITVISENLTFNDNTHFYNLSHLDDLLSCLVHVTAHLGWSETKERVLFQLVDSLCELIVVFHCGKGPIAAVSVMGLNITRHVILILNHLVAEMRNVKLPNWHRCFLDLDEADWLKSFLVLWKSRDVLVRAAALQFFAGLAISPNLTTKILNDLKDDNIWYMSLNLLLDNEEASVVRENAGFLLANLLNHKHEKLETIFGVFDDHLFFKNLVPILMRLYTLNNDFIDTESITSSSLVSSVITPSFVKSITNLLLSLFKLNQECVVTNLLEHGIVKMLFKCITNPYIDITDTKKMSVHCEILEMDSVICHFLYILVQTSVTCLGTILHTRDCLSMVISLLNPKLYHTNLPQLLYLRNKLWTEIFKLLSVLSHSQHEGVTVLTELIDESGREPFLETICQSAKSVSFTALQSSVLSSLTSLCSDKMTSTRDLLDTGRTVGGTEICKILLNLYELSNMKASNELTKKKSLIISSLTSLLCVSCEAKKHALSTGLPTVIIKQLKEIHLKLSLESMDLMKRQLDKKRILPILKELDEIIGLSTNFMFGDKTVKDELANLGLGDYIHKLWSWISMQHLTSVLKMLNTFTSDCTIACQSLTLTNHLPGTSLRKVPGKSSLIYVIIQQIEKEMDLVNRNHNLEILRLCFGILKNAVDVIECRIVISKSSLLNSITKLHPAITKKQKPWDSVELEWLEFLQCFTLYPEGQTNIAKINHVFELLITLSLGKQINHTTALMVLRNIAFYQPNRARLLTSDDFIDLLKTKLENGNNEEKQMIVVMMWSIAANFQKAKTVFRAANLDVILEQVLKQYQLSTEYSENIDTMNYVLSVIRDRS